MIPELGLFSLILALMCACTLMINVLSLKPQYAFLTSLSFSSTISQCFFVTLSFATLVMSFVSNDFSLSYVAINSNTQLPLMYRLCAAWGGHEGSLLLWVLILSLWMLAFSIFSQAMPQHLRLTTLAILGAVSTGFILLILFSSSPFMRELPFVPIEGNDLNPLLQDPAFVLHPPILYMGYVGFAIPFALSLAYLITKPEGISWAKLAKPWVLLSWSFLTIGITLGSWWAYYELGWGGWWFWDPVENASLMPWLAGLALIHALIITTKENELESWSILLALCAFILSLIGTFLVRSGIISSVHAFASDPQRGVFILFFLVLVISASFFIYAKYAKSHSHQTHWLSRKSFLFLATLLIFVALCSVLLGTLYPIFMEVLVHEKISVGPPYFNSIVMPIFIAMLVLMIAAPHLQWQKSSQLELKSILKKLLVLVVPFLFMLWFLPPAFLPVRGWGIFLAIAVVVFTLYKGYLHYKKHRVAWSSLAMILAHLGFALSIIGMICVTTLETETELPMKVGQSKIIDGYQFRLQALSDVENSNSISKQGHFIIQQGEKTIAQLWPEKRYFLARDLALSETAIHPGLMQDFYIALGDQLPDGSWSVRIYIKPYIRWIWLGGLMAALGALCGAIFNFRQR